MEEERNTVRESLKTFLNHIAVTLDHNISFKYQTHELEGVQIKAGEVIGQLAQHVGSQACHCDLGDDNAIEYKVQH